MNHRTTMLSTIISIFLLNNFRFGSSFHHPQKFRIKYSSEYVEFQTQVEESVDVLTDVHSLSSPPHQQDHDSTLTPQQSFFDAMVESSNNYKENSRAYRRVVFQDDDWKSFRSTGRLYSNLLSMVTSGTVRGLAVEISTVFIVSILVYTFNIAILNGWLTSFGLAGGSVDELLSLPVLPFQITSPALGLLLVFRTNTVYGQWNTARTSMDAITAHALDLNRWADL